MAAQYTGTDHFRGARLHLCDLAGLEIRDCQVGGLKIVDCYGGAIYVGGDFVSVVVNDVEVTAYVQAELDRRHPVQVSAREATSPGHYRSAWADLEAQWSVAIDRAALLPETKLYERVDDEWSFVETLRHLLFAGDAWFGNAVLEEADPYHPLGLPAGGMPPDDVAKVGLTIEASPTFEVVLAARRHRMATMRPAFDTFTEGALGRTCGRRPADGYPGDEYIVRRCLKVVLREEAEHLRYALRDLAVLEAGKQPVE